MPEAVREDAELFLAEKATLMRPDQLSRVAHRLALEINPDGQFSDEDRARKRTVVMGRQQPDGMTEIRINATPPEMLSYVEAVFAKYAALVCAIRPIKPPSPTANRLQSKHRPIPARSANVNTTR